MTDIVERIKDAENATHALFNHIFQDAREEIERLRAKIAEMEQQEPVAFALYSGWARKAVYLSESEACEQRDRRQLTADLGGSLEAYQVVPLYALPGAQDVPKEAIAKILAEVMNIAVSNGADSRSMPDEYVEVAAWLCGIPAQNAPSVPENYFGMTLHDKIEAMENKL